MVNEQQQALWHDTLEDAIRSAVDVLGGPKRVGSTLWPTKRIPEAARLLSHCLDTERPEKLSLGEIELIGAQARQADCHTMATYLMRAWGYGDPQPIEPHDEHAELQRQFMRSVEDQKTIMRRLEQLQPLHAVQRAGGQR
jgi:hypothetical protein